MFLIFCFSADCERKLEPRKRALKFAPLVGQLKADKQEAPPADMKQPQRKSNVCHKPEKPVRRPDSDDDPPHKHPDMKSNVCDEPDDGNPPHKHPDMKSNVCDEPDDGNSPHKHPDMKSNVCDEPDNGNPPHKHPGMKSNVCDEPDDGNSPHKHPDMKSNLCDEPDDGNSPHKHPDMKSNVCDEPDDGNPPHKHPDMNSNVCDEPDDGDPPYEHADMKTLQNTCLAEKEYLKKDKHARADMKSPQNTTQTTTAHMESPRREVLPPCPLNEEVVQSAQQEFERDLVQDESTDAESTACKNMVIPIIIITPPIPPPQENMDKGESRESEKTAQLEIGDQPFIHV